MAEFINERLAASGIQASTTGMGNVVVRGDSNPPRAMITAHMDQVAFMVSRTATDHAVCLPTGEPGFKGRTPVRVLTSSGEVPGELERGTGNLADVWILRSPELASVRPGDRVLYAARLTTHGGDSLRGPALDNRIGCWLLLQAALALRDEAQDFAFVWTVREEGELSGVVQAARVLAPEAHVAVDITYAGYNEETGESDVVAGAGPAVTVRDGGMIGFDTLIAPFAAAADAGGIHLQREIVRHGVSEAGKVLRALGVPAVALLVAIEEAHSPYEKCHASDIREAREVLIEGLRRI